MSKHLASDTGVRLTWLDKFVFLGLSVVLLAQLTTGDPKWRVAVAILLLAVGNVLIRTSAAWQASRKRLSIAAVCVLGAVALYLLIVAW